MFGTSVGLAAFVNRAIARASDNFAQSLRALVPTDAHVIVAAKRGALRYYLHHSTMCQPPVCGSGLAADPTCRIQHEAAKVHVDISQRIGAISLMNLPIECHPRSTVTDKIASEIARQRKILHSPDLAVCPYLPMWAFAPNWATRVRLLYSHRKGTLLSFALLRANRRREEMLRTAWI